MCASPASAPLGERLPWLARLLVPPCLVLSLLLMALGMYLTGFTLHVRGVVGLLLGEDAHTSYSMLSLCSAIGGVSTLAPAYVMAFFELILILTCVLAPLLWPLVLLSAWLLPWRPRALRTLLVVAETTYAWAKLDVFCVIVAAALLELDEVAKFTLGDECDGINAAIASHPELAKLLPGEPSCFGVAPTLDVGFVFATLGVVLATLAGGYATVCANVAVSEHVARARVGAAHRAIE